MREWPSKSAVRYAKTQNRLSPLSSHMDFDAQKRSKYGTFFFDIALTMGSQRFLLTKKTNQTPISSTKATDSHVHNSTSHMVRVVKLSVVFNDPQTPQMNFPWPTDRTQTPISSTEFNHQLEPTSPTLMEEVNTDEVFEEIIPQESNDTHSSVKEVGNETVEPQVSNPNPTS